MPPPPPEMIELPDGYRVLLPWGFLQFNNNEVTIASTIRERGGDPGKFRIVSTMMGSLGAWSFGYLRDDGVIEEMVLLQGKQDERYRNDPNNFSAELTLHLRDGSIPGDAGFKKVIEARHDGVWFKPLDALPSPIPPSPPAPTPPPPPPPNPVPDYVRRFFGPDGRLDFDKIKAYFGFESEDREHYEDGDMSDQTLIDQMLLRFTPTDPDP